MARPATKLDPRVEAEIVARTARGESAAVIKAAVRGAPSVTSLVRLQARLRGKAPAEHSHASPAPSPDPTIPDEVPEGTPIETLDRWVKRLEKAADEAEANKNLAALASIAAKITALLTLRHRATPLPKPDPNENPDMRALAAEGEKRLIALVHDLFASQ